MFMSNTEYDDPMKAIQHAKMIQCAPLRTQATGLKGILVALISAFILAGVLLAVFLANSNAYQQTMADTALQDKADHLQAILTALIQSRNPDQIRLLADQNVESGVIRKLELGVETIPGGGREVIYYDQADQRLVYDPDQNQLGDEITLCASRPFAVLRDLYFSMPVKSGGVADQSTLNVWMELDASYQDGRRNPDDTLTGTKVVHRFQVKLPTG